jgi:arylformamidase
MNLASRKVWDISPLVWEKTAVFPGDTVFSRKILCEQKKGDGFDLSSINTTVHLGAHTDAPNHYDRNGVGIDQRPLEYYLGDAQVISVKKKQRILVTDLEGIEIKASRILFKTNSFPDPEKWNNDFTALSAELIDYLYKKNVCLVGIDTPSIDPAEDKSLESHHAVARNDMAILEGIVLTDIKDGVYQLIALPLKIKDADASPVRAVLVELELEQKNL